MKFIKEISQKSCTKEDETQGPGKKDFHSLMKQVILGKLKHMPKGVGLESPLTGPVLSQRTLVQLDQWSMY